MKRAAAVSVFELTSKINLPVVVGIHLRDQLTELFVAYGLATFRHRLGIEL